MSRTRKGSRGPGWEPWSNRHEKALQKATYHEVAPERDDDICPGCRFCECVKCGGANGSGLNSSEFSCIQCGHVEDIP